TCIGPATLSACGADGGTCQACAGARADVCSGGACRCGANSECAAGQRCSGGVCVCDAVSCASGCCGANGCVQFAAQDAGSCGAGGAACQGCSATSADRCTNGSCRC